MADQLLVMTCIREEEEDRVETNALYIGSYGFHHSVAFGLYILSQKTGLLRLILHNFTSSRRLLIIFDKRPCSILD